MGIKDDANSLDSSLKRGAGSARSLAAEVLGVDRGIVTAARHAVELGEALALSAKISESIAGPLVKALAVASGAVALFTGWHQKSKEIATAIGNINAEIARSHALARNDVRLANEIQINAKRDEALQQLEKERGVIGQIGDSLENLRKKGGIIGEIARSIIPQGGFHLYNYNDLVAAIKNRADAEKGELIAGINRQYGRQRADLANQVLQNSPNLAFLSDEQRQLAMNDLAREAAERKEIEQDEDAGLGENQIRDLVGMIGAQFDNAAKLIKNQYIKPLGDQLGRSFADSIAGGIAAGIQAGSIQKGFRSLLGGMLSGLGSLLVTIGTQSLLAANLFSGIVAALRSFAPAAAIGPSLALIALGGILMGVGAGLGGGFGGGGGGGFGGGSGFGGSGSQIIDRGIINPLNPLTAGVQPRANNVFNNTFIGPRDPVVQRQFQELLKYANARGSA